MIFLSPQCEKQRKRSKYTPAYTNDMWKSDWIIIRFKKKTGGSCVSGFCITQDFVLYPCIQKTWGGGGNQMHLLPDRIQQIQLKIMTTRSPA